MFESVKFYIIVGNNSFIIKNEDNDSETTIDLDIYIPNIPAYHHLFDTDKADYIKGISNEIKRLKVRNATIILPDDCIDLEVDKRLLIEFFLQCGVKRTQLNFQCFLLNLDNKKYISVSRTARTMVIQYIVHNKSISKRYYEKNYRDIEQIALDMKKLHSDCEYGIIPVYINNLNNDMEGFKSIGNLVSKHDIIENVMSYKINN